VATTHVFIDTNVALHYQRPDQIDWLKLLGSDGIVLVAAPILLSELEKQKIHNPSRKLRERADAFIRWLAPFVRDPSIEVRSGVRWHFVAHEPLIDFRDARLSPDVADDQLIASVLGYKPDDGGAVCVATGDIGLEVKLRPRKFTTIPLPEDLRLPAEPDPQEKELQELRRQAAQRRAPVLVLTWEGGAAHWKIATPPAIRRPSAKSIEQIRSRFPFLVKPGEKRAQDTGPFADIARIAERLENIYLTPEAIDRYNEDLKVYFSEYETYLEKLLEWETGRSLTGPLRLVLSNGGNAPASQIDVMLTFPDDVFLMEKGQLPKRPEAPKAPRKPAGSFKDLMNPGLDVFSQPFLAHNLYRPTPLAVDGEADIDGGGHKVGFEISKLKHLFDFTLKGCFFQFPSREAVRSFQVQYHVSAAELPEAITGALHIVVDDTEREAATRA